MCSPAVMASLFGTAGVGAAAGVTGLGTASALAAPTAGLIGSGGFGATMAGWASSAASSIFSPSGLFSLAGFGVQAYSAGQQGAYMKYQAEHQANMARYNAMVADNNALAAKQAAEFDADMIDDRRKRGAALAQVKYAKSGVVINQDTPLKIEEEIAMAGMQDRLARIYQGDTEAAAFKAGAAGHRAAASNYIQSGKNAVRVARLGQIESAVKYGKSLLA